MLALLAPLASWLGLEATELVSRMRREAAAYALIAAFALIGAIFLLVSANAGLAVLVGPVLAPLILGGSFLLIAGATALALKLRHDAEARRRAERQRAEDRTALVTTAIVTSLPVLMKSGLMKRLGLPVGGALAAAYFLTRSHAGESGTEEQ